MLTPVLQDLGRHSLAHPEGDLHAAGHHPAHAPPWRHHAQTCHANHNGAPTQISSPLPWCQPASSNTPTAVWRRYLPLRSSSTPPSNRSRDPAPSSHARSCESVVLTFSSKWTWLARQLQGCHAPTGAPADATCFSDGTSPCSWVCPLIANAIAGSWMRAVLCVLKDGYPVVQGQGWWVWRATLIASENVQLSGMCVCRW